MKMSNKICFDFQRRIPHPNYTSRLHYDDIALLELETQVTFGPRIKPICLHTENDENEKDRSFTIIGFGISDFENSEFN